MRYLLSFSFLLVLAIGPARLPAQNIADDTSFVVKLMAPLSTETNRKGDKITAVILQPPAFAKSFIEGEIRESKARGKLFQRSSALNISFQRIVKRNKTIEVECKIKEVLNSKNERNADEEGRMIEYKGGGKSEDAELETKGAQLSFAAGTELTLTVRTTQTAISH